MAVLDVSWLVSDLQTSDSFNSSNGGLCVRNSDAQQCVSMTSQWVVGRDHRAPHATKRQQVSSYYSNICDVSLPGYGIFLNQRSNNMCMAVHGGAWLCMAVHGGAWRCMAVHGGACP